MADRLAPCTCRSPSLGCHNSMSTIRARWLGHGNCCALCYFCCLCGTQKIRDARTPAAVRAVARLLRSAPGPAAAAARAQATAVTLLGLPCSGPRTPPCCSPRAACWEPPPGPCCAPRAWVADVTEGPPACPSPTRGRPGRGALRIGGGPVSDMSAPLQWMLIGSSDLVRTTIFISAPSATASSMVQ